MSGDAKRFRQMYGSAGRHGESFWQEEKDNVGVRLLKGMGWSEGQGLGKDGNGRTVAVKQTRKKDNAGIGSKKDTRDEAFRASQDLFNDVLSRLSGAGSDGAVGASPAGDAGGNGGDDDDGGRPELDEIKNYSPFVTTKNSNALTTNTGARCIGGNTRERLKLRVLGTRKRNHPADGPFDHTNNAGFVPA